MVDHFQLSNYEIQLKNNNQILVLVERHRKYYAVLRYAFPKNRFSRQFDDIKARFDWGTYIDEPVDREQLKTLIDMMKKVVCIDDALEMTFALDYHSVREAGRTQMGQQVYEAKPYSNKPNIFQTKSADKLAKSYCEFINQHPAYARADYLLAIPSRSGKSFDLPNHIVKVICHQLGIPNGADLVHRVRETSPMKDLKSRPAKMENVRGAFALRRDLSLVGKTVIVIDDIYQTGITLHEMAMILQDAGATVFGLVATKTLSDPK